MGVDLNDKNIDIKINKHFKALEKSIRSLKNGISSSEKGSFEFDDIFPLALLGRTIQFAEESKKLSARKNDLYAPVEKFKEIVESYCKDKKIIIDSNKLMIQKTNNNRLISFEALSSGEKQIFIFLLEILLQENRNLIFIADEPELSLHVSWQERIISDICNINPKAQIIVATHSPEIAASRDAKVIKL